MIKNNVINYKLVNITLFFFVIYLLFKLNFLNKIIDVILLITISLIFAYIIYPIYKKLNNKLNRYISVIIIYFVITIIIIYLIYLLLPSSNFMLKIIDLFNNILLFINKLNIKYNLYINIELYLNKIISYILNNSIFLIGNVFNFITKFIFVVMLSICILFNINTIKKYMYKYKHIELLNNINIKLKSYVIANLKIIVIQIIEYTTIFYIIGHPNYLLLGLLNSINSFIPVFGSVITNIIAVTTASVISKKLLILTSIISILLPNIDAYFISPKIYKNTNKLSQTLTISVIILGGTLFGFYGLIISLPILIIIIEIIKYTNAKKV